MKIYALSVLEPADLDTETEFLSWDSVRDNPIVFFKILIHGTASPLSLPGVLSIKLVSETNPWPISTDASSESGTCHEILTLPGPPFPAPISVAAMQLRRLATP